MLPASLPPSTWPTVISTEPGSNGSGGFQSALSYSWYAPTYLVHTWADICNQWSPNLQPNLRQKVSEKRILPHFDLVLMMTTTIYKQGMAVSSWNLRSILWSWFWLGYYVYILCIVYVVGNNFICWARHPRSEVVSTGGRRGLVVMDRLLEVNI